MSINSLYSTWKKKMEQLRPQEHRARVNILVWLIVGIYASRSVQLGRIAAKIPGERLPHQRDAAAGAPGGQPNTCACASGTNP